MALEPLRVACIGMGWWSDVLADAIKRSGKLKIVACYTRSEEKRRSFAEKYRCRAAPSYKTILADPEIEAIINTTPNDAHLGVRARGRLWPTDCEGRCGTRVADGTHRTEEIGQMA